MSNNPKNKKQKVMIDPYFLLSLYNGTYQNGGDLNNKIDINTKPTVLDVLGNYNNEIPNQSVFAAYGKMLKRKYAYGGAGGEDPNIMKGMNWNAYLNARDEDLLKDFAADPSNPHSNNSTSTEESSSTTDWNSFISAGSSLGVSAINAFGNDEQDRITGKGVRQQAGKTALKMGAQGAQIGSFFGPWGTVIGGAAGAIGGGIVGTVQAKNAQEDQADYLKDLYYGALGGELPDPNKSNTEKRKQTAFTLRPDQYGDQNYFDWAKDQLPDDTTTLVDLQGNYYESGSNPNSGSTEKTGLWESAKQAMNINENTRDSGRDVGRVKLNAFVDRDIEPIPSFGMGGPIDEIKGPRHDQGGVQLTPNAEVEGGEVKVDNYIFSDRLTPEGSNKTFAYLAKQIKKKYEERPDDGPSIKAQKVQLNELMLANEDARIKQEAKDKEIAAALESDVMAYGGCIKMNNGGKIEIDPAKRGTFTKAAKARGMGVQEFAQKILGYKTSTGTRANGGPLEDGSTPTATPVEVYPGSPGYGDYIAWKAQNDAYTTFDTEHQRLKGQYGEGTSYKANQFKTLPGMQDFNLPEGASGVVRYKTGDNTKYSPGTGIGSNYYTAGDSQYVYIPTYEKPKGDYKEVTDPKVAEQESKVAAWKEETKDIQGYIRKVYSEPVETDNGVEWVNKTELIPVPNGQEVPTDGTFVPKGSVPPKEYIPKMAKGGPITPYSPEYLDNNVIPLRTIPETNFDDFTLDMPITSGQRSNAAPISSKSKEPFKVNNEEMSLLLSNLPALDNIMSSFNVEKTKLQRVKPEEISLEKQRQLVERQATIGRNINRENIRSNAGSSGAALSTMAAANSAITESVIQSHLQSLIAEETANTQIRNQANETNTQLANQETVINEQNRAMGKSILNMGLADIGTNTQSYLRDKKLTAENIRQNKRLMSVINAFAPNYRWEDDNGEFAIQFITAANMNTNQLPPME